MSTLDPKHGTSCCLIITAPVRARLLACLLVGFPLAALSDVIVPSESVESSVNIRAAAEAGAEVIAQLRLGDSVELVGSIEHWHEVTLADGRRGFISSDWTDVVDADAVNAPAETDADAPVEKRAGSASVEDNIEESEAAASAAVTEQPTSTDETEPRDNVTAASEPASEELVAAEPEPDDASEHEAEPAVVQETTAVVNDAGDAGAAEAETVAPRDVDSDSSSAEPVVAERRGARKRAARTSQSADELAASAAPGSNIEGTVDYLTKFTSPTTAGNSQVFDDGINVGIGTAEPEEPLDVNGNLQIYNRNSNLAAISLRQSSGDAGYITHNLAGTLIIGAGSEDRITILGDGNVGVGTSRATHPLEMASGAHVTAGGVWTNASSRDSKQGIEELSLDEAMAALGELTPVLFSYKVDPEDAHVGFIAEDAPELVASKNRRGLSAMDIVAVLTRVVQAQQQRIEELESRLDINAPLRER